MPDLLIRRDIHEPGELARMVGQVAKVATEPLNQQGYADWMWEAVDGQEQMERKTWNDLLGDLNKVEDLLRRQLQAHPKVRLNLLVEGVATPSVMGTATWGQPKGGKARGRVMYLKHEGKMPIQRVYKRLREVSQYCQVWFTSDMTATARMIVAFARADLEANSMVLRRHLKITDFHPNPQVKKLMGVAEGIGPTLAEALIDRFGTVVAVLQANPEDLAGVEGIGYKTGERILREAGRTDI